MKNKIIHYKVIDSTQKEIWRRVEENAIDDGTVIIADIQTDAIGTHGRKWHTSEEDNIAFSFVKFPNVNVNMLEHITIDIAKILVDIFQEKYRVCLEIKEPNDLMIKGKKLGGVLAETKLQGKIVKDLVIGIGINTNQTIFNKEIEEIATSTQKEFGISICNENVIQDFLNRFEELCENDFKYNQQEVLRLNNMHFI